ncbi:putative RNA-directed DNA polymerase from transposon X-element [Portunus trituberculatus]|uniref:Putative RNA-directed DNA polymerase from transposon X-element n=1 Tax=Portunus trituberculatus TaxID=210409 RepID=A0A5B7DK03_PORTR|nr:putative RNA-directed DNA polymerase from transposon X-element [Portunus trituberculatus]
MEPSLLSPATSSFDDLPYPTQIFFDFYTYRRQFSLWGDLNARYTYLGYTTTNQVGRDIVDYFRRHTACHIGPHFPTFYNYNVSSSPDIAITNRVNFLHYSLSPGPLTTSDHIPIILDISTSPLLIPSPQTFNFHKTNWDSFKDDDVLRMKDLTDIAFGYLEDINEALETWMTTVRTTADRHIPQTTYKLRAAPRHCRTHDRLRQESTAEEGWPA